MALEVGSRLGHYDVTALIGEGGMGQVYQATDTKLKRQVALKILPEAFSADPERLARFQREAEVLASLNHPNIAAIHGLEEADDTRALVLELVEGPTLADRIKKGPIPLDEALPIAKQIAEALEAAHEAGVIHRDLKPANIKVRDDGTVKVLDFGLAKAFQPDASDPSLSQSPTISLTAAATQMGMVIGTAAYMAPEQASGKVVDKRADIWAFGVVLYEMLTGRRPFVGDDVSKTLAHVIAIDPDWSALPKNVPPVLGSFLRGCLEKEPRERVRDIGDVRLAVKGAFDTELPQTFASRVVPPLRVWQRPLPLFGAGLVLIVVSGLTVWNAAQPDRLLPPASRLSIALPQGIVRMWGSPGSSLALSPDGTRLVYVGNTSEPAEGVGLNVRSLNDRTVRRLPGTGSSTYPGMPQQPFFSPNGQWVGFFTGQGELRKVAIDGGDPVTLLDNIGSSEWAFGTWGEDDTIIFSVPLGGLRRISANGGPVEDLTIPDRERGELEHIGAKFLPGARVVVFSVVRDEVRNEANTIDSLVLNTGERRTVVEDATLAFYAASGHLGIQRDGSLMAAPFDVERAEVVGPEVPLTERVRHDVFDVPQLALSRTGTLVFVPPLTDANADALMWVSRSGEYEILGSPPRGYASPHQSPDGRLVAVVIEEDDSPQVHLYDLTRDVLAPLTREGRNLHPVWTPDGRRVVFGSRRDDGNGLYWTAIDGIGNAELLLAAEPETYIAPYSWTPDGQRLAYMLQNERGEDIWVLSLEDSPVAEPFLESPSRENNPAFSPDGRWLAYVSDESGQFEVYVRRYPSGTNRELVSQGGGLNPAWSRDGSELFYHMIGKGVFVVPFTAGPEVLIGSPHLLFRPAAGVASAGRSNPQVPYGTGAVNWAPPYDIGSDGDRLLMVRQTENPESANEVVIVQNWHEELKRLVPVP